MFIVLLSAAMLCGVSLAGCSGPSSTDSTDAGSVAPVSSPRSIPPQERPNLIAHELKEQVIGTWLGQASLDQDQLTQVLASLPAQRRGEVERLAREFLTTVAAVEIAADGRLEQEIEIVPSLPPGSAPIQAGGIGRWQVLTTDRTLNEVVIALNLTLGDGSTIEDQMRFEVVGNGQQLNQFVALSDELDACRPKIVFQKQSLDITNVAEGNKGQLK